MGRFYIKEATMLERYRILLQDYLGRQKKIESFPGETEKTTLTSKIDGSINNTLVESITMSNLSLSP